jgi:phospholipid-binding lipoprotein MlaA
MHRTRPGYWLRLIAAGTLLLVLQSAPAHAAADPFEAVNRHVHRFNQMMQAHVLQPIADLYVASTTPGTRRAIANAMSNLAEPLNLVNGLVAADMDLAWNAAARFGINSTLGLGGVRDRAAALGFPARPYDLGNAACSWGVPSGPYVVLPLLGPSTLRDATALAATSAALINTLGAESVLAWRGSGAVLLYTEVQHELARIEAQSLDPYAVYRSAYLQRRAALCATDRDRLFAGEAGEEEALD